MITADHASFAALGQAAAQHWPACRVLSSALAEVLWQAAESPPGQSCVSLSNLRPDICEALVQQMNLRRACSYVAGSICHALHMLLIQMPGAIGMRGDPRRELLDAGAMLVRLVTPLSATILHLLCTLQWLVRDAALISRHSVCGLSATGVV